MKKKSLGVNRILFSSLIATTCLFIGGQEILAKGYDANSDYKSLDVKFWNNEKPEPFYYVNASNRYLLDTTSEPANGVTNGEWLMLDLLRGMYTGADYINHIPSHYIETYLANLDNYIISKNGDLSRNQITEWARPTLVLTPLNQSVTSVTKNQYNFLTKFSESFKFTKIQGLNGPIWTLIALNSGDYKLYPNENGSEDWNSEAKMLDYIVDKEIKKGTTEAGGWALSGREADPDMTGMALQALAPYYLSEEKFHNASPTSDYVEFKKMVERAIFTLSNMQGDNGTFLANGDKNPEGTTQAIVALTALNINPLAQEIRLPNIGESVTFITKGAEVDGVWTNNMIDGLLSFWSKDSGENGISAGFKRSTADSDDKTNQMSTEQATYGLIAYQRFLDKKQSLYNMTDQMNTPYTSYKAKPVTLNFDVSGVSDSKEASYLSTVTLPKKDGVITWNTKIDGTGVSYQPGDKLSVPKENVTLYAQSDVVVYQVTLNLNEGQLTNNFPTTYQSNEEVILPVKEEVIREGYEFSGWYTTSDFQGEALTVIPRGQTEEVTLFAKWKAVSHEDSVEQLMIDIDNIGEVTLEKEAEIEELMARFNRLSKEEQAKVTNQQVLKDADKQVTLLKQVTLFSEKIMSVTVGDINSDSGKLVKELNDEFDKLGDTGQALVEKEVLTKFNLINDTYNKAIAVEEAKAKDVVSQIDHLVLGQDNPNVTKGNQGEQHVHAVKEARASYNGLTTYGKQFVTNLSTLQKAEKSVKKIENVESLIKGLPKTNEISLKDKEKIEKAEQAFNDLTAIEKESVSNQADLLAARKALDLLDEPKKPKPKPKPNPGQTNGVSKGEDGKGKPGTDKPDKSNKGNVNSKPTGVNQRGNNSKPSGTNQRHLPQTSDHSSMVTPLIGLTVLVLGSVFIWKRHSSESK